MKELLMVGYICLAPVFVAYFVFGKSKTVEFRSWSQYLRAILIGAVKDYVEYVVIYIGGYLVLLAFLGYFPVLDPVVNFVKDAYGAIIGVVVVLLGSAIVGKSK